MQQIKTPNLNTSIPAWIMALFVVAVVARVAIKIIDTAPAASKSQIAWRKPEFVKKYDKSADKLLLFDFTAEWCRPCKAMDKTTFLNRRITNIISQNFEAVRVVDREQEEGKNPKLIHELQKDYGIWAFPTVVVALPDLTTVSWRSGYLNPRDMAKLLTKAKDSAGFVRAMVLVSREDYRQAEKYLKDVKDEDWEGYQAREKALVYWLVYQCLGQKDKALAAVNSAEAEVSKLKDDDPEDMPHPLYKYMRGEISAEKLLEKCETKYDQSDARCAIALTYLKDGNKPAAVKELIAAVRVSDYSGTETLTRKLLDHLDPQGKPERPGRGKNVIFGF